ncbi:MAG: outer membrane beta-barrel protein [Breznakibacter sp.]
MKKIILLVTILAAGFSTSFAQLNYKAFKVDVGGLYAIPTGDGVKAGIGFYVEPKYNLTDHIAAGFKMEWAIMGAEEVDGASVDISAIGSYQVTGDYYFGTKKVRPFAGLGMGIYSLGTATIKANANEEADGIEGNLEADFGNKFGFAPRVGILMSHFRIGLEYNIITGLESGLESKNYLALKVGFEIGGGKK